MCYKLYNIKDGKGVVIITWYSQPPNEVIQQFDGVLICEDYEERTGYYKNEYVDLNTNKLIVEYVKHELTTEDKINELQTQQHLIQNALNDLILNSMGGI